MRTDSSPVTPRSRRKPALPSPRPDPLGELIAAAAADPATDERVRRWLARLLGGGAAEGGRVDAGPEVRLVDAAETAER